MRIYLEIIKFNFLRYLTYPIEIVGGLSYKLINIAILILFWSVVAQNTNLPTNSTELASYFLIGNAVGEITMIYPLSFGKKFEKSIKTGEISRYMTKPLTLIPYLYATTVGETGLNILISFIGLIIGALLLGTITPLSILLFILFIAVSILISIGLSLFVGILAIHIVEVEGFRNALVHLIRILSGYMVPLAFFPQPIHDIVMLTPFPYLLYGPIQTLKQGKFDQTTFQHFAIAAVWAVVLPGFMYVIWKRSLKKYEAIGI